MITIAQLRRVLLVFFMLLSITAYTQQNLDIEIDGSKKLQRIDGIGVNVNTRSWNEDELKPAINALLDSMHFNIWRVIAETVDGWEVSNDNNDPFTFNWNYYDSLYETPKFRKAWGLIAYLNKHGITDNLMINFMGFAPAWMGDKIIETKYEDEYVEMIVSFFYYALKKKHLKFGLIAPTNESDHHKFSEGPHLTGEQHARILHKTITRMDQLGITANIKLVAPDNASNEKSFDEFLPAMLKDRLVMSRIADIGFHSYSGDGEKMQPYIRASAYPHKPYWITEWNAWCNGCDDGILGDYNYAFACRSVKNLLRLLRTGASASLLWEGYDSYYSHHAPSKFSYWGVLGYDSVGHAYYPRKHFYAIQQVSKYLMPGSRQVALTKSIDSVEVAAFVDSTGQQLMITGINSTKEPMALNVVLKNIEIDGESFLIYTDEKSDLKREDVLRSNVTIPADCIFTIVKRKKINPEPENWYAGDIHVHRNCGDSVVHGEDEVKQMMQTNDLAVMSLLADMGNAEVKDSKTDLPKINGKEMYPAPGRVMKWDAEWHWDATYSQFSNQALGGHLVLLGLNNAHQIWEESPYKVLEWAKRQDAVRGFAHFQYLNDSIQKELNCCIPIDYPVEAALGTIDFVSEDVSSVTLGSGGYNSEAAVHAYYKLLNCGFRLGFAAGTDYPCNNNEPPGSMLTYARVDGQLTYRKWIDAIKHGRTVVSRDAHKEFLDLKVNDRGPGDELKSINALDVNIEVIWTTGEFASGAVELVHNGQVIASQPARADYASPFIFKTKRKITESGWICARRMGDRGHYVHTAPVYLSINNKPVRASTGDATYFVKWIENILEKIGPGGPWARYFTKDIDVLTARYKKARDIYKKIASESDRARVLLFTSKENYGNYTAELLKAEGISSFVATTLSDTTYSLKDLRKRKIVILSTQNISDAQASVFDQYVKEGGRLISTMPVKQLDRIFGLTASNDAEEYNYIILNKSASLVKGITTKPMRLHAKPSNYELAGGARAVANFHPGSSSPAIVYNNYGKGQALSFLYNLPESVVLTRQGNPADAGREMDSIPGLRAMDLFTNGWVDTACNMLNHADEQMRILSRAVEQMSAVPMPKLWYFPDTLKCVVTLNNDGEDSKEDEFEPQFNDVYAKGAKMTLYIKEVDLVSKAWSDKWRSRGFEISGHPDQTKYATNPSWHKMDTIYSVLNNRLKSSLGVPSMQTVTNHWFVWPGNYDNGKIDFAAQARLEQQHGVGLDCNYAHYDNNAREKKFLGSYGYTQGNYTGSGLPMKFADAYGNIIDVYQQLNNVYDQQYMEHNDKDGYFNAFRGLMDRSIDSGVYSYISVRSHNNEYFFSKAPLMKMLDYANAKHIPVWTELQLLQFLRARDEASISNVQYSDKQLTFTLYSSYAADVRLTAMIPSSFNGKKIDRIVVDGEAVAYSSFVVKGARYAFVPVDAGISRGFVVSYK